jgi:hypothetical protein
VVKGLILRSGVIGLDKEGSCRELERVRDQAKPTDSVYQVAQYAASIMAAAEEEGSSWQSRYASLGKPGDGFKPSEAMVGLVDEAMGAGGRLAQVAQLGG